LQRYFIPSENNQFRAKLLSTPFLLAFTAIVFIFNFGVGISLPASASDGQDVISIQNLLDSHNAERAKNDLPSLELSPLLSLSAKNKAQAMLESDCWDHYCPEGKSPWDYFEESNYDYVFAGENLAEGFYSLDVLMNAWMNSSTHRDNILKSQYSQVGFGIVYGDFQRNPSNVIVAVHFGTPKDQVRVASASAGNIVITNPETGDIFDVPEIEVEGNARGYRDVYILRDGSIDGKTETSNEGIFTYDLEGLIPGEYRVGAASYLEDGTEVRSEEVEFVVTESFDLEQEEFDQNVFLGINITPSNKNMVNLGFVVFLALLFLFDFIFLAKTDVVKMKKSYSHFHFVMLIAVGLIIVSGGFSGEIGNGIVS
jgi:hypothetical protein